MEMEINKAEEYLGLLRENQAAVQRRLKKADEQIGVVCDALYSDGISELSSSDDKDMHSDESEQHWYSGDIIPPSSCLPDLDHSDSEWCGLSSSSESFESSNPSMILHNDFITPSTGAEEVLIDVTVEIY